MTKLTPRVQTMFEKTKTVCFGRFLVDVPASATVAWGEVDVPLGISVYPNGVAEVSEIEKNFIDKLKSEKNINRNHVPLLIAIEEMNNPEGKIIIGYEDFESIDDLKINGYFRMNNDGVIIDSRPLQDDKDKTIADIKSIARRLRRLPENEIPTEPGNCIEYAFLPDDLESKEKNQGELIRVGFRLKEFPDTHLSIFVGPSNPHYEDSDSLKWQLERLEKRLKAEDPNHPNLKTRYLRRGDRQIHDWVGGFEALSHTPDQPEAHPIHDFGMDFRGVPYDPYKPYADIRMQTGVADNVAGATKASLTDEEAIAVWDRITSTIRVRPTSAARAKDAEAEPGPRRPLGELAATGRTCPQTGWWTSDDVKGESQHVKAGAIMPHAITSGEPSLWQKFTGGRPIYRTATMWKLVGYDNAPAHAKIATQTPADGTTGERKEDTPPPQKG
ncbi:T6SS immunity protein Tli4 family protein [Massilia orientalis]|uniref:T6SS immunity protein Tli4 family protein n=1 Tax=Massilia orientalis TaxID=3050128 RepID=A0ACC7MCM2_9BURK|nr:T6SS immunity protein Tli4 family protein [Massilia sp. YIM B02787]